MTTPSRPDNHETARYLATIRDSIAADLKPALQNQTSVRAADAIILTLGRVIERIGEHGDTVEQTHSATIANIASSLASLANEEQSPKRSIAACLIDAQSTLSANPDLAHAIAVAPKGENANTWLRDTCSALCALWDNIEDGVMPPSRVQETKSTDGDVDKTRAALEAYLIENYPDLSPGIITGFKLYYGGYVKQMARFTLAKNPVLPSTLVLRRDMAMSMTGTKSCEEFPIIQRAYKAGLPVPKPIFAEADETILGGTFLVMEEIPDAKPAGSYFAKERAQEPIVIEEDFGLELAKLLADLHVKTESDQVTPELASSEHEALQAQLIGMRNTWMVADIPDMSLSVNLSLNWLVANPLPLDRPRCLVHGDCGMHNLLVRDGKIAALVDWELAHDGDPAEDLAMIRMMVSNDVIDWGEFIVAYIANGGKPAACDAAAVAYYGVLLFTRHLVGASGLRPHYFSGENDNVISASVLTHSIDRMLQYQCRALNLALNL